MPYMDLVREYSRKNRFEYDHKAVFGQVRAAMAKSGVEREAALKDVLKRNYLADAEKYEPRRKQIQNEVRGMGANENPDLLDAMMEMSGATAFLEQYVDMITAMAKDIDATFEPEFMLGIASKDAKNLVSGFLSSYSRYDESKHTLKTEGWETAFELVERCRYSRFEDKVREYSKADENVQNDIKETYIRKKIVQEELNSHGFFWRLFHRSDVKTMRNYIGAAERALADVGFPKEAAKEADADFAQSAALETEYAACHDYFDEKFKAEAERLQAENEVKLEHAVPENAEKEKVNVVLDEPATDKSEKINEPDKSVIEKNIG